MTFVKKSAQPEAPQTEELKKKIEKLKGDFETYARINLKILTKAGTLEPFLFNEPQKYVHALLEKQLKDTGKIRALWLKARQQGASTYTGARFYFKTSLNHGRRAFILTHEQAATANLFALTKRYHDNSHPGLKPVTGSSNVKELIFSKLDSGYKVGTAASKAVGRSGTIQFFHGSECAHWENAYEHFSGVMECIPDEPGTEVILETTAAGCGGKFYDLWTQAVRGEGDYIAVFVPWFYSTEYRRDATGFVPTAEELEKQKIYGVDLEQLAFRRAKINSMGVDLANQEYPYCWQDAFLSSGRTVFDKDLTAAALKECWAPKKKMVLENGRFVERSDGELSVWEEPKAGRRYVIGADVAEGLDKTGDYSCADVLDILTGQQCAHWHGHIAPDVFARVLAALGKWYNSACIAVESNNHGLTTNTALRDGDGKTRGYPNIYVQTTLDDRGSSEKETRKLGFSTNRRSKPYIIDLLSALFRENDTGIACKETIEECQTYIVNSDGSYGAISKCYDDRVMSYAIAVYVLQQEPAYRKKK